MSKNIKAFQLISEIENADITQIEDVLIKIRKEYPLLRNLVLHFSSYEVTRYLVETKGACLEYEDEQGDSPIFSATGEKLKYLLSQGANVNKLNDYQENALYFVKNEDDAKLLLDYGINAQQINKMGNNILWYQERDMTEFLLKYTDLPFNLKNNQGNNLLIYKSPEDLDFYIANGTDPYFINNEGDNVLLLLCKEIRNFQYDTEDFEGSIIKLMTYGVSPLIKNKEGVCALDLFSEKQKEAFSAISEMLESKIQIANELNIIHANNKKMRI